MEPLNLTEQERAIITAYRERTARKELDDSDVESVDLAEIKPFMKTGEKEKVNRVFKRIAAERSSPNR